jgi:putative ABC transport system permease protein
MSLKTLDLLNLTYKSLTGNLVRSTLTSLGVFMGVAAVNATLQVGSISEQVIAEQLSKREAPQINAYIWLRDGRSLRLEDMEFLKQRLIGLKAISTSAGFAYDYVVYQDRSEEMFVEAVSEDYLLTSGRQVLQGRFFNNEDFSNFRPVVAIDNFLRGQFFENENPIGKRLYIGGKPYIIIGVVETKLRYQDDEPKGEIFVPLSLRTALTGRRNIGGIQIRPSHLEDMESIEEQTEKLLLQRFPGGEFYAWNNAEDILEQKKTLEMTSRALLAVGAIALLVGGVGIANITIASTIERTPEIGLRRALGATRRDIMLQFILEAALLSLLGGTLAIASVHSLTVVVAKTFDLPYNFEEKTAAIALGSAVLVGVGAGFLPALKASQLDPVKALRLG